MIRAAITRDPVDACALLAEVGGAANGAAVLFTGTVREVNAGRPVDALDYEAYEAMAARELDAILHEVGGRFGVTDLVAEHRLGALRIGDVSVAVAVAHPHRGAAFDAAREVVEELKRRVPIWKREHYVDGSREWVGHGADSPGQR